MACSTTANLPSYLSWIIAQFSVTGLTGVPNAVNPPGDQVSAKIPRVCPCTQLLTQAYSFFTPLAQLLRIGLICPSRRWGAYCGGKAQPAAERGMLTA